MIPIREKSYVNVVDAYAARRPFKIVRSCTTIPRFEAINFIHFSFLFFFFQRNRNSGIVDGISRLARRKFSRAGFAVEIIQSYLKLKFDLHFFFFFFFLSYTFRPANLNS